MDYYKLGIEKLKADEDSAAFELFTKGMKENDPKCVFLVGTMHLSDRYPIKNVSLGWELRKKAVDSLKTLADCGDEVAVNMLGDYYLAENNPERDVNKGIDYLSLGVDLGNKISALRLADYYCDNNEYEKAHKFYKLALERGEIEAYGALGEFYEYGRGCEKNLDLAFKYYKEGAEKGDVFSTRCLADIYYDGDYVTQDKRKAAELYLIAANGGSLVCYHNAYLAYEELNEIEKAKSILELGVKHNEPTCCNDLALLLEADEDNGEFQTNCARIIDLYKKAIKGGDNYAKGNLGIFYYLHADCENEYRSAAKYLEEAIEGKTEDISCYFYLGELYRLGELGKKNYPKARYYYEQARALGYNCNYSLEILSRDERLEKFYQEALRQGYSYSEARRYARECYENSVPAGETRAFINYINSISNLSLKDRKALIQEELRKDLAEVWDYLEGDVKKFLVTGLFIYSVFIGMGYEDYQNLDFSPVINQLSKAYELILKKYFFVDFISYLEKKSISPTSFMSSSTKKNVIVESFNDGSHTIVKYADIDEDIQSSFTLGSFPYIVESGNVGDKDSLGYPVPSARTNAVMSEKRVNKYLYDYVLEIFDDTAFPNDAFCSSATNYLIDLACDTRAIASRRNPSSHSSAMNENEAEVCADYLIKVRKVIYNLIIKIKPENR